MLVLERYNVFKPDKPVISRLDKGMGGFEVEVIDNSEREG